MTEKIKMGKGLEQTFLQRNYTNGQQAHEKMFNSTNYQGNANQNHNELPPHTHWKGYNKNKQTNKQTNRGAWVTWSVERPTLTLAQVMITGLWD